MLEAKVDKGRVQLKCCGEIAEVAADIMMNSKSWEDTMKGPGVCIVIPHRREERND